MIQPQIHDSELIDPFLSVEVRLRTDLWFSSLLMFVEKLTGALQLQMQLIKFPYSVLLCVISVLIMS